MFTLSKNFIKVNEDLFEVVRTYHEEKVLNADMIKQWLGCEIIFKKDQIFYFCNKVIIKGILNYMITVQNYGLIV